MPLTVNLNQNERIIVNGAVITPGKKAGQMVFLNRANILHQHHVLTEEKIIKAMHDDGDDHFDSWFYYLIQLIYIDPANGEDYSQKMGEPVTALRVTHPDKNKEIDDIIGLVADGQLYQALKMCRDVFPECLVTKKNTSSENHAASQR